MAHDLILLTDVVGNVVLSKVCNTTIIYSYQFGVEPGVCPHSLTIKAIWYDALLWSFKTVKSYYKWYFT